MTTDQYRRNYILLQNAYEKQAYRIVKKHLNIIIKGLSLGNITADNAKMTVEAGFDKRHINKMYFELYRTIGLQHGKFVVRNIDSDTKDIGLTFFEVFFNNLINTVLINSIGSRITTVSETMIDAIVKIIKEAYKTEDLNIMQIRKLIYDKVRDNNFYRYQALRIARTETTTISNYATLQAGRASRLVMTKKWVSIQSERTRVTPEDQFDHLNMNDVVVELEDLFNVDGKDGNNPIMYPGDQELGVAGNIINCRCAMTLVPKRDSNGRPIRKTDL
jgi:hypothetical protein